MINDKYYEGDFSENYPVSEEEINDRLDEIQRQWEVRNAEYTTLPILGSTTYRTMEEWQLIETPWTSDDLLDTKLFIRRLP